MTELFAALGAVSGFLQVVDFTARLTSAAGELVEFSRDALREDGQTKRLAQEYKNIAERFLNGAKDAEDNDNKIEIVKLGQDCTKESQKLLDCLQALQSDACRSKIRQAAKALTHRKSIEKQRRRVIELNSLLATRMLQELWERKQTRNPPGEPHAENVYELLDTMEKKRLQSILETLQFPGMRLRESGIETAWKQTYCWALRDESIGLVTWLEHGHGIYWISGKAGSGKSTLMKFLCNQDKLQKLLRRWSGDRKLVFANFFFWYAGKGLQNSIAGLLRSMLFQILSEVPSLVSVAFRSYDEDFTKLFDWTQEELVDILKAIILDPDRRLSHSDKAFCFFIDGLDEYEGNHSKLTYLLSTFGSCSNLKLCLSSRPWNAFVCAYEGVVPSLKLHELTRSDIVQYASDEIGESIRVNLRIATPDASLDEEVGSLVRDIADRAEGVFLWVFLAVKSVCRGMTEGDNIAMLRYRVSCFPPDLEDFFRAILSRIDPEYAHQTYQSLKLACMWNQLQSSGQSTPSHVGAVVGDNLEPREGTDELQSSGQWTPHHVGADPRDKLGPCREPNYDRYQEVVSAYHCETRLLQALAERPDSFVDFWLIKQDPKGLSNVEFAFRGEIIDVDEAMSLEMWRETRTFLSATCKDLLCLPSLPSRHKTDQSTLDTKRRVEFLHRTVYDFLNTEEMQKKMDENVPTHFQDWRILHLLNLKRVKYVFKENTSFSNTYPLEEAAVMSLKGSHADLSERYVDQFDRIGEYWHRIRCSPLSEKETSRGMSYSMVLATLIAFQKYRTVFAVLNQSLLQPNSQMLLHDTRVLGSWNNLIWTAALGGSPLRQFPLYEVNLELVERLLRQQHDTTSATTLMDRILSFPTLWHTSLGKSKVVYAWPSSDQSHSNHSRHIWNIIKLFLQHGVAVEEPYYIRQEHSQDVEYQTLAAYIVANFPQEWLQECDALAKAHFELARSGKELRFVPTGDPNPVSFNSLVDGDFSFMGACYMDSEAEHNPALFAAGDDDILQGFASREHATLGLEGSATSPAMCGQLSYA